VNAASAAMRRKKLAAVYQEIERRLRQIPGVPRRLARSVQSHVGE